MKFIAVHCSATPPIQDIGLVEIDRMHRLRGFRSCGYHYIVRRNGVIEEGRALGQRGAHVEGHNHESIGICLIGGVNEKLSPEPNFNEHQLFTLSRLLKTLAVIYPDAKVQGHRDFPNVAKACPSFDVAHWLKTGTIKP